MENLLEHLKNNLKQTATVSLEDDTVSVYIEGTPYNFNIFEEDDGYAVILCEDKYSIHCGHYLDDISEFYATSFSEVSFIINDKTEQYLKEVKAEEDYLSKFLNEEEDK